MEILLLGIALGIVLHRLLIALVLHESPDSLCAYCKWLNWKRRRNLPTNGHNVPRTSIKIPPSPPPEDTKGASLHEAAMLAARTGGLLTRPWGGTEGIWFIKPTNGTECCMMIVKGEKEPCPRWNPKLEDLIAKDWKVVNPSNVGILEECVTNE